MVKFGAGKQESVKINNDGERISKRNVCYKKTKFNVDVIDHAAKRYDVESKSHRIRS